MGIIKLTSAFFLICIFALAIIMYTVNYSIDNDSKVILDSQFNSLKDNIEGNTSTVVNEVQDSSSGIFKSTVSEGSQTTVTGEGAKKGYLTAYQTTMGIIPLINSYIFGNNQTFLVITTLFGSFILLIIGFYAYKLWLGANPD